MRTGALAATLLFLLCAAAVLPTGPAAAQSGGGRSDLAVTSLTFAGPEPYWTAGEASGTEVRAVVTNLGSAPAAYQVDYLWIDEEGFAMPLNGYNEAGIGHSSLDISRTPLGPGEQRTHKVSWTPTEGQDGNGTVLAAVSLANVTGTGERTTEDDYSNNDRRLPTFIAVRAISFDILDRPAVAEPGARGFFRLLVRNDGNMPAPVTFRLVEPVADARLSPCFGSFDAHCGGPFQLLAPQGSQANVTLYVDYDPAGDFTPFNVTYTVEADPGYLPLMRVPTPWLSNGSEEPSLEGFAARLAWPQVGRLAAARGTWTETSFTLTNEGSRPDTYVLQATTGPAGWDTVVVPGQVALYPGESSTVRLRTRAPSSAALGSAALVNVTALPSLSADGVALTVPAFVPGAQLAVGILSLEDPVPYVRDAPIVLATVVNEGSERAKAGAVLRLKWTSPGSPARYLDESLPAIAPGEILPRAIALPTLEAGGPLTVEATVDSVEGLSSSAVRTTAFIHEPILALSEPVALEGSPGETVTYQVGPSAFRLHNLGNAVETVIVGAVSDGGAALVEGGIVTFGPGEQRTLLVRQTLPGGAPNGTVGLAVTARLAHRADHAWTTTTATRLVDDEAPHVRFDPPLPAEWNAGTPLDVRVLAQDAGALAHVVVTVLDPAGNLTLPALVHDGNGTWASRVTLPTAGNYTIVAAAADLSGNAANASQTLRVGLVPAPRLRIAGPAPAAIVNATDRVRVLVDDERPIARVTLEVRQAEGTTRRDLAMAGGAVEFDLQGAAPGQAELVIEASNAAGASSALTLHVDVAADPPAVVAPSAGHEAPAPAFLALAALGIAFLSLLARPPGGRP
ncbi:MAG TPA: hypothetical protein VM327_04250 [Candidatus Thermoplasmatota archaeon]|nr:hypothetical protein [Candidatus Thermoplasmatota archaeon]